MKPAVPTIFKSFVDKALTGNLDMWNVTLVHFLPANTLQGTLQAVVSPGQMRQEWFLSLHGIKCPSWRNHCAQGIFKVVL